MRLIDADALLEELKKTGRYFQAKFDIENAPTVDNPYQEGYIDGMLQAEKLYARPQGEWIQSETDRLYHTNNWKCSNCHSVYVIWNSPLNHDYNFCPNCGARMQKGGDNNG